MFGDGASHNIKKPPGLDGDEETRSNTEAGPPRNTLGYVEVGHGNDDHSTLNGQGEADCLIRSTREDRLCMKQALSKDGYVAMEIPGVVGQTVDVEAEKQIKGVITLPTAVEPNVYAANEADLDFSIKYCLNEGRSLCQIFVKWALLLRVDNC